MGRDNRQEALAYLLGQAEKQGYVTFDNIMDCADANSLPIKDFDWLTSAITTRGILVYDEAPASRTVSNQDDDDFDDYAQSDYEAVCDRIIELEPALEPFITDVRNIVPPQWREFTQLKYQALEGNQHARNRMIEMHLRIAVRIALQRAEAYDMDIVDAVGEACIGLVTAVDKYDPDTNGPFGSYAAMWVLQNISRRQSTRRPLMYYPVHKKDPYFSAYPIIKASGFIDNPELYEIEEVKAMILRGTSLSVDQVDDAIAATVPFESFEDLYDFEDVNDEIVVPDELVYDAEIEQEVAGHLLTEQIAEILDTLTEREKNVIELRYGLTGDEAKTLEEVGTAFGVTRERIRQIEAKAIRKLRHPSRSRKLRDYIDFVPKPEGHEDD